MTGCCPSFNYCFYCCFYSFCCSFCCCCCFNKTHTQVTSPTILHVSILVFFIEPSWHQCWTALAKSPPPLDWHLQKNNGHPWQLLLEFHCLEQEPGLVPWEHFYWECPPWWHCHPSLLELSVQDWLWLPLSWQEEREESLPWEHWLSLLSSNLSHQLHHDCAVKHSLGWA